MPANDKRTQFPTTQTVPSVFFPDPSLHFNVMGKILCEKQELLTNNCYVPCKNLGQTASAGHECHSNGRPA